MKIYEYSNYREFVNDWVLSQPSSGRGQFLRMAKHLGVHPTLMTHIFKGTKELALEHGQNLCEIMNLSTLESDYFMTLIQYNRAGTEKLRLFFSEKLSEIKSKAQLIQNRINYKNELSFEDRCIFYSNWKYSAVRVSSSLPEIKSEHDVSEYLNLPLLEVRKILKFLIDRKLVILNPKNLQLEVGPSILHLEKNSPLAAQNHRNWRAKSLSCYDQIESEELAFTAPLTLSIEDAKTLRSKMVNLIEDIALTVADSESESGYIIHLDWLKLEAKKI